MEKYVRISEAANYLGVSVKTMHRWNADGRLPASRIQGNQRAYQIDDLERFKSRTDFAQNYDSEIFKIIYDRETGWYPKEAAFTEALESAKKMGIDLLIEVHTNPVG